VSRYVPPEPLAPGQWFWRYCHVTHTGTAGKYRTSHFTRAEIPEENVTAVNARMDFKQICETIQAQHKQAVRKQQPMAVHFEPGDYVLTSPIPSGTFKEQGLIDLDADRLGVGESNYPPAFIVNGNGAKILFKGNTSLIYTRKAGNLSVSNFTVDYDPADLRHLHSKITKVTPDYVDIHAPNRSGLNDASFRFVMEEYKKGMLLHGKTLHRFDHDTFASSQQPKYERLRSSTKTSVTNEGGGD